MHTAPFVRTIAAILAAATLTATAGAQFNQQPPASSPQAGEAGTFLKSLSGQWDVSGFVTPGPGAVPASFEQAKANFVCADGGTLVLQHGAEQLVSPAFFFSTENQATLGGGLSKDGRSLGSFEGGVQNGALVLTGQAPWPVNGKNVNAQVRVELHKLTDSIVSWVWFVTPEGGERFNAADITLTRQSNEPSAETMNPALSALTGSWNLEASVELPGHESANLSARAESRDAGGFLEQRLFAADGSARETYRIAFDAPANEYVFVSVAPDSPGPIVMRGMFDEQSRAFTFGATDVAIEQGREVRSSLRYVLRLTEDGSIRAQAFMRRDGESSVKVLDGRYTRDGATAAVQE